MKRFFDWVKTHQFVILLVCAVAITITMTLTSLWIYRSSGDYRFDLSRPGYEDVREEVKKDDPNELSPFPVDGILDADAVQDFRARYDQITKRLNQMNNYDAAVLSDENLGLTNPSGTDENSDEIPESNP